MAAVCRLTKISQPASGDGVHGFGCSQQAFSKTTKQQELGVAVHSPAKLGVEAFWTATFKKAKKKSTILPTKYSAFLVENSGIEPLTSCMPCKRSPEPRTHAPPHKGAGMIDIRRYNALFRERRILTQKQLCCLNEFY